MACLIRSFGGSVINLYAFCCSRYSQVVILAMGTVKHNILFSVVKFVDIIIIVTRVKFLLDEHDSFP